MNSRLNMAVREKCGLVYSIDAYLNTYPDTGFWNVYFGCDQEDVERCCKLVERELAKLAHQRSRLDNSVQRKNSFADRLEFLATIPRVLPWLWQNSLLTLAPIATLRAYTTKFVRLQQKNFNSLPQRFIVPKRDTR